jgi:hypothetical protein
VKEVTGEDNSEAVMDDREQMPTAIGSDEEESLRRVVFAEESIMMGRSYSNDEFERVTVLALH